MLFPTHVRSAEILEERQIEWISLLLLIFLTLVKKSTSTQARSVMNYLWYYFMVIVPPNSTSNSAKTYSKKTIFLQGFGTIQGTI